MKTLDRSRPFGKLIASGDTKYAGARWVQDGLYFNNQGNQVILPGDNPPDPQPAAEPDTPAASAAPVGWRNLHWMQQRQIANQIAEERGDTAVIQTAEQARSYLAAMDDAG